MNNEIFDALDQLETERGIPKTYMIEKLTQALIAAYKKDTDSVGDNVYVDLSQGEMNMYVQKTVVDDVYDPDLEIDIREAEKIDEHAAIGNLMNVPVKTRNFGRIAAQTAKQVIIQGIREAERGMVFDTFSSREHEIISGTVSRIDQRDGSLSIQIGSGNDRTEALLSASEQIRGEVFHENDHIRVYVVEVRRNNRGPQVIVSRTHPGLVKRLFELEVPEIQSGEVEIKAVAREAGNRSKLAVWSSSENVDAVGACVGPRGGRVNAVVEELKGEKMDIIPWSEDPAAFVGAALAPATALHVTLIPGQKACRVVVPDDQLSLAIGREGQNARLAARLTGYKIDIKSVTADRNDPLILTPEEEELPTEEELLLEEDPLPDAELPPEPETVSAQIPSEAEPPAEI